MALLLPLLAVTLAAADPLATWSTRTGVSLVAPAGVRVQPLPTGVALVGPGVALQLASAQGDDPLGAVLDAQLAPFLQAGARPPAPTSVACAVAGVPTTCRTVTVEVVPGATLRVLAGQPPDADWTAVCLVRAAAASTLCDPVLRLP